MTLYPNLLIPLTFCVIPISFTLSACGGSGDSAPPTSATVTANTPSSSASGTSSGTTSTSNSSPPAPSLPDATMIFNYANFGSAPSTIHLAWGSTYQGSVLQLTNGTTQHQANAAWHIQQQDIQSFSTDFTFYLSPSAFGLTFCIQNTNSTTDPNAYGLNASANSNGLGYAGYTGSNSQLQNSIAIKFDTTTENSTATVGTTQSATGLYINGGPSMTTVGLSPQNDLAAQGINLHSGDLMSAHVVYDGTNLTMVLQDTVTGKQARMSWPIDIPAAIGGNSAWVGFTAGTVTPGEIDIDSWDFYEGYSAKLAPPAFSVAAGQYTATQTVSLSAYSGATIYYTTNGQSPTTSSTKYTGPITVNSSEVVQAIAVESGYADSLVGSAYYQIAPALTPTINFPSGFSSASNLITTVGNAAFNGSTLQMSNTTTNNVTSAAWFAVPVNVQEFSTNFTMQFPGTIAAGMTFAIQNYNPASSDASSLYVSGGPFATGFGGTGGLGYQGLLNSVAISFPVWNIAGQNTTGLYLNGATPAGNTIGTSISPVAYTNGNPIAVSITYNGTTLSMTMTDTVTHSSFSKSWTVDIPGTVGGNTAYVGFTAATVGGYAGVQNVLSWTYAN